MSIERLLAVGSHQIAAPLQFGEEPPTTIKCGTLFKELIQMLAARNGFYAFEAALHVLPWTSPKDEGTVGLQEWNAAETWRGWYGRLLDGILFFAEDAFGVQFGLRGGDVVTFEPEAGDIEVLAHSLDEWASKLMVDYCQLTGYPVAHAWQSAHGPIPPGKRLLPKTPFILGGLFDTQNLVSVDAIEGMRYRGELWQQLKDLPDGAQIRLKALPLQ